MDNREVMMRARTHSMKICMLAPEFYPVWGGVGTYILELICHLPSDFEIHVVTPRRTGFGADGKVCQNGLNHREYLDKENVYVHYVCEASDTFFYNAKFQLACAKYVPKLVRKYGVDLIHSHTAHMPDLLLMLRKLDVPTVTTIHTTIKSQRFATKAADQDFFSLERSEKATYLMYPALRLAENMYFRRKRYYITPSTWMKKWIRHNFFVNGSIQVIPNSVDLDKLTKYNMTKEYFLPEKFRNRRFILYVGRLLAMKGLDVLIESIPKILEKVKKDELLFVFAGPGDSTRYIRKLREAKVNSKYYVFTGPLSRKKAVQLIAAADLVVLPSLHENCSYIVLEAMACGKPVVASDVTGISEQVISERTGFLVEPGNAEALASKLKELLQDEKVREHMGRNARNHVTKNFSWQIIAEKALKCYRDLLEAS